MSITLQVHELSFIIWILFRYISIVINVYVDPPYKKIKQGVCLISALLSEKSLKHLVFRPK